MKRLLQHKWNLEETGSCVLLRSVTPHGDRRNSERGVSFLQNPHLDGFHVNCWSGGHPHGYPLHKVSLAAGFKASLVSSGVSLVWRLGTSHTEEEEGPGHRLNAGNSPLWA